MESMGGDRGWKGSMRLQWLQWLQPWLVEVMSSVMLGQNMEDSALAIMAEVPWWAACNAVRQSCLRDDDAIFVQNDSIYSERYSRNGWYILRASGMSCRCSGMPPLMVEASKVILVSLVVAMRTLFQLIACKKCKEVIMSMWVTSLISGSGWSD